MGWRRFACAGVLVVGGCASTSSADAPDPVPMSASVPATDAVATTTDAVAATTAPALDVAASPPGTCADDSGGAFLDESPSIDDWVVGVQRLPSGDVRLLASAATGQVLSLGCMSGDTAGADRELGLSLASVRPVAEGVGVVIAIPTGRQLVPLGWLDPRSAAATNAGYDVSVFLATEPPVLDATTPSVAQLARLVTEAFDGTSTVAGLAPDILVHPVSDLGGTVSRRLSASQRGSAQALDTG